MGDPRLLTTRGSDVSDLPSSVATMMAEDRASASMGMTVDEARDGRAVVRMRVGPDMVNGHAIAHGGLIFALADTAFACACNSFGPPTVAAAAEIVFVSPGRLDDELVAEAARRTQFGRTGIYDVTVRRGDEVVAEFRGRSHTLADSRGAP
jgi:acyl-CoA thioesterase